MMQLATRTSALKNEAAFAVLAKAEALERRGKSIIHLEIGQPDFPTPQHIAEAGIQAIKDGKTKYTPSLGIHALREVLASMVTQRTGVETTYQQIAVTPSCKTAIFCALGALVNPGDEVLYPDPGFPAYKILIEFFGGKAVPIPLIEEREFSFDMTVFRKRFSRKTKAIILNFPGNPTGTILPREDLQEIAARIAHSDTWVMSDEIYTKITYDNQCCPSIYSLPDMKSRTIIVDGFSKTYAMTGWRLGFMVVPEKIIEKIEYFLTHAVACTAAFTQEAGIAAITGSQDPVKQMVSEFKKRRDFLVKELNSIQGITCFLPQGAFYVFPNIKSFKKTAKELSDYLLEEAGVALLDGTAFGQYGEGYLRISYATSMKNLKEGLQKIRIALEKL